MPHLRIEYSENLRSFVDMKQFCLLVSRVLLTSGLFEPGAPRIRAFAASDYVVADDLPENSFVDVVVRLGMGRSLSERQKLGEDLFSATKEFFSQQLQTLHFAVSMEICEINSALSWKANSLHKRLRKS